MSLLYLKQGELLLQPLGQQDTYHVLTSSNVPSRGLLEGGFKPTPLTGGALCNDGSSILLASGADFRAEQNTSFGYVD